MVDIIGGNETDERLKVIVLVLCGCVLSAVAPL